MDGAGSSSRGGALWLAAALALASAQGAVAGTTVEGRVELPETAAAPVAKPRYPVTATYEVGEPDPPRAIVYLHVPSAEPAEEATATVAQSRYQFSPGLAAVRKGTAVSFPNRDEEYHSVFSYSKPKRFDLGRYQRGEEPPVIVFDEPGVVRLFCEIHDHMRGTILVLDTPYFTRTDADGRYRLEGLPAGRFELRAWVEGGEERSAEVELVAGKALRVDFPAATAGTPK